MGAYLSELWCWLGFAIASWGPNGLFIFATLLRETILLESSATGSSAAAPLVPSSAAPLAPSSAVPLALSSAALSSAAPLAPSVAGSSTVTYY